MYLLNYKRRSFEGKLSEKSRLSDIDFCTSASSIEGSESRYAYRKSIRE